jgi:hypothetical protein
MIVSLPVDVLNSLVMIMQMVVEDVVKDEVVAAVAAADRDFNNAKTAINV